MKLDRPTTWSWIGGNWIGGGVIALALAAGCGGGSVRFATLNGPQGAVRYDQDGDGAFGPWVCPVGVRGCDAEALNAQPIAQLDCDDNDPKRYPGAPDPEGDGIDQNCDDVDGVATPTVPSGALPMAPIN